MTVIAAIAREGRVVMACDSAADYSGSYVYKQEGKIAVVQAGSGDTILMAAAGNASLLSVITRNLKIDSTPGRDCSDDEADLWADTITAAITDIAAESVPSLLNSNDGNAQSLDGTLLIAWQGHVWFVFAHSAIRPSGGVVAIGSGTDVAVGAMNAALQFGAKPEDAVDTAVRLACRFADGCRIDDRGPLSYWTVP